MEKITKKLIATLLILVAVFVSIPATVFAESEFMEPGKTYKLTVNKSIDDNLRRVAEEVKSGKSVTFNLEVPKGALYVQLVSSYDFKVEILDSNNKVVKEMKPFKYEGEEEFYFARSAAVLSKGKYKMKISPVKKQTIYVEGFVNVIKNDTSRTITVNKDYYTYVTKGKTYKLTFKVKEDGLYNIDNFIIKYDVNDERVTYPEAKLLNSEGKKVATIDEENCFDIELKKGEYTITFKASQTGCLYTEVYEPLEW